MKKERDDKIITHFPLPYLGHRIMKTAVAVFLCLVLHWILGYEGMALQSVIAAILCIRPYIDDSKAFALERSTGTLIGALWGMLFLFLMDSFPILSKSNLVMYFLMSVGVLVSIYSTVVIKYSDTAALSAIVFACVVVSYPNIDQPYLQAIYRVIDTIIGLGVAMFVNVFALPREKQENLLFFVRMRDIHKKQSDALESGVMIALSRLNQDGAKISLISEWAPATLLSQLVGFDPEIPAIVMDGAAIYDVKNRKYLDIIEMPHSTSDKMCKMLDEFQRGYCVFGVRGRTTLIYRVGPMNDGEEREYEKMKRSHLRNYLDGMYGSEDQIVFARTIDKIEIIDELEGKISTYLNESGLDGEIRMVRRTQPMIEGYDGLYFYSVNATVENMKNRLLNMLGNDLKQKDIVLSGETYDPQRDAVNLLHRLRITYEPLKIVSHMQKSKN